MNTAAQDFLEVLDLERNYSPYTVKSYKVNLKQFLRWSSEYGVDEPFRLTSPLIREFIHYLREELGLCDRSIEQKLATLKSFIGYLRATLPKQQIQQLAVLSWRYKTTKKLKQSLAEDELMALLGTVSEHLSELQTRLASTKGKTARLQKQIRNAYRDRLILLLMVGSGMRVGEVARLNVDDIFKEEGAIRVLGKGSRERQVYYDIPEMMEAMDAYLRVRDAYSPTSEALFVNSRDGGRLTVRRMEMMLKGYLSRAGLRDNVTPHTLRHTFASLSIEHGANIKAVSQMLGHAQVGTTLNMYTHLSEGHVRKVFKMCHPMAPNIMSTAEILENRRNSLMYLNDKTNQRQRDAISSA